MSLIAKQGLHIIVDVFITSKEELEHYQKTLAQYGLLSVYLYAPANIIIDREKQRGDRLQGSALHWLKKFDFVEDDYHLSFNTHLTSIEQIREEILKRINFNQNSETIKIRPFIQTDVPLLVNTFAKHQWPKPKETFESYWFEQCNDARLIWLAIHDGQLAGYVTLKWVSNYQPFKEAQIPEIMDLNVLPPYRNKGIGSRLLATAEKEAGLKSSIVGLGTGLYRDYGAAQKLYIKTGYKPDGNGVTYQYQSIEPGNTVCLDDDLILWFTKKLNTTQ